MEWRPIFYAPKTGYPDGIIDLWIVSGYGYREENCWWDDIANCWANHEGRMYHTSDLATNFMVIEPPKQNGE